MKFEIGKTYKTEVAIGDYCAADTKWGYEFVVTARTACFVTFRNEDGDLQRCKVQNQFDRDSECADLGWRGWLVASKSEVAA